ncbi:hypothetical protein [Streptomyces triculaminicus]|uniref:hypothetical protein n=1 Tax=Streptomyces triculaminicus TaxID=2816232 RepID=UPI0037A31AD2
MTEQLVPPPPSYPPSVGAPAPDWWDALYSDERRRPIRATAPRLPDWQIPKPDLPSPDDDVPEAAQEPEDGHSREAPAEPDWPAVEEDGPSDAAQRWLIPAPEYYPPLPIPGPPPALSPRTCAALYNLGAAGSGYAFGLVPALHDAISSCGEQTSIGGALFLGGGICLITAHFWDRRTRHWYRPLAWAARIPLASAITALALYTPAATI